MLTSESQSPAAFYIYNTVKIITAAAVTNEHGQLVCGTTSVASRGSLFIPDQTGTVDTVPATFSNMNGNQQAYFGGFGIDGWTSKPTGTSTVTASITNTFTESTGSTSILSTESTTWTATNVLLERVYTDALGNVVTQGEQPTGVVISMTTPFVYQPARGAKGATGEAPCCVQGPGTENYGYVPQTLLDFLVSDQQYSSQYPGLASCLPGGPSILPVKQCTCVAPTFLEPGGDLTSSTTILVTPKGQQTSTPAAQTTSSSGRSSSDTYPPTTQQPGTGLLPSTSTTDTYPPTTQVPGTLLVGPSTTISTDTSPPSTQVPGNSILSSAVEAQTPGGQLSPSDNTPKSTAQNGGGVGAPSSATAVTALSAGGNLSPTPPQNQPNTQTSSVIPPANKVQSASSPPAQNPSAPATTPPIGQIINSILDPNPAPANPVLTTIPLSLASTVTGVTTTISSTPFIIVPAASASPSASTTIPLSLASAFTGSGITTTISSTPFLIIPVPPSQSPPPQIIPSSEITVAGGTTELIIPGPTTLSLKPGVLTNVGSGNGKTTVVGGVTEVVVSFSGATTVPIVPTGVGGNSSGIQIVVGAGDRLRSGGIWGPIMGVALGAINAIVLW